MSQTISSLNEKMWYRLLKVIYVVLFVVFLSVILRFVWMIVSERTMTQDSIEKANAAYSCNGIVSANEWLKCTNSWKQMIEYTNNYSTGEKVFYILLSIIFIFLLFEGIRRIFYYIIMGTMWPVKK